MTTRLRTTRAWVWAPLALAFCCLLAPEAPAASSSAALSGVVNINTASAEELQLLPGVGRVRADAILVTRKERGGFKSVDDLTAVNGIGQSMLKRLRPHVTLKGKTTARSTGASGRTSDSAGQKAGH